MLSAFPPTLLYMGEFSYLWNSSVGPSSRARLCIIGFYYPIRLRWSLYSPAFVLVEGLGAVGLSAHCYMGEFSYLWNSDAGPSSRARLCIIVFYYPIRLRWSLYSPAFVLVEGLGAVGLSAHCYMGEFSYLWNRDDLISYSSVSC